MKMGRADILFRFLQLANMNRSQHLEPFIRQLDQSDGALPLTSQIADQILLKNPNLSDLYQQAWQELYQQDVYDDAPNETIDTGLAMALTYFIREWTTLEGVLAEQVERENLGITNVAGISRQALGELVRRRVIDSHEGVVFNQLRNLRNEIAHGRRSFTDDELSAAAKQARQLTEKLRQLPAAKGGTNSCE